MSFDNLYSLIDYYRAQPLKAHDFEMHLTDPVPQVSTNLTTVLPTQSSLFSLLAETA